MEWMHVTYETEYHPAHTNLTVRTTLSVSNTCQGANEAIFKRFAARRFRIWGSNYSRSENSIISTNYFVWCEVRYMENQNTREHILPFLARTQPKHSYSKGISVVSTLRHELCWYEYCFVVVDFRWYFAIFASSKLVTLHRRGQKTPDSDSSRGV